jgi:AhpD family alkylhydroperoxidase
MRIKEPYPMTLRLPYWTIAPKAVKRMMAINSYLVGSAIESSLRHLIWLRVSQINGCAYCVDLHTHEALRDGESLQRLNCLVVWAETPLFSDRERSALAWAEALTNVSETHAPDELYEADNLLSAHSPPTGGADGHSDIGNERSGASHPVGLRCYGLTAWVTRCVLRRF